MRLIVDSTLGGHIHGHFYLRLAYRRDSSRLNVVRIHGHWQLRFKRNVATNRSVLAPEGENKSPNFWRAGGMFFHQPVQYTFEATDGIIKGKALWSSTRLMLDSTTVEPRRLEIYCG